MFETLLLYVWADRNYMTGDGVCALCDPTQDIRRWLKVVSFTNHILFLDYFASLQDSPRCNRH